MIVDTFPFNKDFNTLKIRLNELFEVVDLFIASESRFTHSGRRKPLFLSENFKDIDKNFQKKLVVLSDNTKHIVINPRIREMIQREGISKYLGDFNLKNEDLISHSDCDEIPRAKTLEFLALKSKNKPINALLELRHFHNYLNLTSGTWLRGRVQSFSLFKGIQNMRKDIFLFMAASQRRHPLPIIRIPDFWTTRRFGIHFLPSKFTISNLEVIRDAGWHFNNLFLEEDIIYKIKSSSHFEWNKETILENAVKNLKDGRDIYTGEKYSPVKIDETFPSYITNNINRWSKFIFDY